MAENTRLLALIGDTEARNTRKKSFGQTNTKDNRTV